MIEEFKEIVWSLKEFVDIEEESLEIFVVTLWSYSDNFEVIVIVNKTSFMVELDDCYCCAR